MSVKSIKILGISGGRTSKLLEKVLRIVKKNGANGELVELADLNLPPITRIAKDPEYDKFLPTHKNLMLLYEKIKAAHGIVLATPVHWFGPSSEMKIFLDLLTPLENEGFKLEGKVAGFVVYGNEGGRISALSQLATALNHMGAIIPPYALIYFSEKKGGWANKDLALLGKNMIALIKALRKSGVSFDY